MPATSAPMTPAVVDLDDSRYRVASELEIFDTLRNLAERRALITANGDGGSYISTAVLAVDPEDGDIVFDYGADQAMTERLIASAQIVFVTQLDHIRIQFAAEDAESVDYEGAPAFRIRVPASITRLQRREYYRIHVPLARPLRCVIAPDPDDPERTFSLRVVDLSCGGVLLSDGPPGFAPQAGTVLRQCQLALPDLGTIACDARVVRCTPDRTRATVSQRIALQFRGLSDPMTMLIQRFINRIERDLKSRH